jgi:hypothetical protein
MSIREKVDASRGLAAEAKKALEDALTGFVGTDRERSDILVRIECLEEAINQLDKV